MNLEVNLVSVPSIDTKYASIRSRSRFLVNNDTEALDSIAKFIADNASEFNSAIADARLVAQLQDLSNITFTDLECLRYILATKRIDLWYWYVADVEVNSSDIPAGMVEYNISDYTNMIGNIPFCTKITQLREENNFVEVYSKINEIYGLFGSPLFKGISNPISKMINSMKTSQELINQVPATAGAYINSVLDFLHKDLKVITN